MCIELNLYFFCFILLNSTEFYCGLLYFILQRYCSLLLAFFYNFSFGRGVLLMFFFKLGGGPFFFWVFYLGYILKLEIYFFFLVVQKLIYFFGCFVFFFNSYFCLFFSLVRILVGRVFGVYVWSFRVVLLFSSLSRFGWRLLCYIFSFYVFFFYFFIYRVNLLGVLRCYYSDLLVCLFYVLSIAGIPPFLGFFVKLFIISCMFFLNFFGRVVLLLIFLLFMFVFYYYAILFFNFVEVFFFNFVKGCGFVFWLINFFGLLFLLFL